MNRVESMLGLAERAGKLQTGLYLTVEAVRSGKAQLVVMAQDAEANTRKRLADKCRTYRVPLRTYGTKESLGHCTGREPRSCAAVLDAGFADSIVKLLNQTEQGAGQEELPRDTHGPAE